MRGAALIAEKWRAAEDVTDNAYVIDIML